MQMKFPTLPTLVSYSGLMFGMAAASLVLGGTGCSKSGTDQTSDRMKDAYHDTKDAMADTWQNVKSATFEKRDDFSAEAKAKMAKFDSQMNEMKKEQADAQASESRKAAWAAVKDSETDYHQKVDALGSATTDTWDSAKANVVSSWDHLTAAYDKARTN